MDNSIEKFIDAVSYFIEMSLENELFQMIYGFIAIAFVIVIVINLVK